MSIEQAPQKTGLRFTDTDMADGPTGEGIETSEQGNSEGFKRLSPRRQDVHDDIGDAIMLHVPQAGGHLAGKSQSRKAIRCNTAPWSETKYMTRHLKRKQHPCD